MTARGAVWWRARWRQLRQPAAFRIAAPEWTAEQRARLEEVVAAWDVLASAADRAGPGGAAAAVPGWLDEAALAEAATNLWRARRRVDDDRAGTAGRETRQMQRLLRASQDALAEAGVVVQDHTGSRFSPGLSLDVLAVEEIPELTDERVRDTVKPTVYLGDRRIQRGQVVIGRPAQEE